MLKRMVIDNFTVFRHAEFDFGHLNVIHGENGTGKTHLLKLVHTLQTCGRTARAYGSSVEWTEPKMTEDSVVEMWPLRIAVMLQSCFAQEKTHEMLHWRASRGRVMAYGLDGPGAGFDLVRDAGIGMLGSAPGHWPEGRGWDDNSLFFPSQDFFARDTGSRRLAKEYLLREETFGYNLLELVQGPRRAEISTAVESVIGQLQVAIGGKPAVAANGRPFIEYDAGGSVWTSMVATGHNKLAILAMCLERLNTSAGTVLLWDEPEANLNPRLIKVAAKALVDLAAAGVQVFVATHSLFLLRQLYLLNKLRQTPVAARYIGLHQGADGVEVKSGPDIADSGDVVALDEQLAQADLYMDVEMGVKTATSEDRP